MEEQTASPECVVCLSEPKDTILLPCRHLSVNSPNPSQPTRTCASPIVTLGTTGTCCRLQRVGANEYRPIPLKNPSPVGSMPIYQI